jgi:hypothetical protein
MFNVQLKIGEPSRYIDECDIRMIHVFIADCSPNRQLTLAEKWHDHNDVRYGKYAEWQTWWPQR